MLEFLGKIFRGLKRAISMDYDYYVDEGWDNYFDGYERHENPYVVGSFAHVQWENGWYQAMKYDRREVNG